MLRTFLKGIIVFVLLSVAYFIYVGMTHHEGEILTQVEIEAPASEVFSYLSDPARTKTWIEGLSSIELISGEEMAVGSKYHLEFKSGNNLIPMTETITHLEANKQVGFDLTSDFVNSHIDINLSSSNGKTIVKETQTYSGNNFLARAMTGMTKRSTKMRQQAMYDKLKDVVENGD